MKTNDRVKWERDGKVGYCRIVFIPHKKDFCWVRFDDQKNIEKVLKKDLSEIGLNINGRVHPYGR